MALKSIAEAVKIAGDEWIMELYATAETQREMDIAAAIGHAEYDDFMTMCRAEAESFPPRN